MCKKKIEAKNHQQKRKKMQAHQNVTTHELMMDMKNETR